MQQLIYVSAAARPFPDSELRQLLEGARARNAALSVSGLLLHERGSFLQVLEGPRLAIQDTFQRISRDSRHHRIVVLYESTISGRSFPDWQMGFVTLAPADGERLEGWSDFFFRAAGSEPTSSDMARRVLAAFRQGRWHALVQ